MKMILIFKKIKSDHTNNSLQLFTNNAERMRIDSSGNILCVANGTQSSLAPFYLSVIAKSSIVYGGGGDDTACLRIEDKGSSDGFYHGIELRSKRGGDARIYAHDKGSDAVDLVFATDNNGIGERMRLDSSGNVGIGITSPGFKLESNGGADDSVCFAGRSDGGNGNNARFTLKGFAHGGGANYGGGFKIQTRDTTNNFHDRLTIDSSGNVGIGTSTSLMVNGKLTVKIDTDKHIGFSGSQGEVGSSPA